MQSRKNEEHVTVPPPSVKQRTRPRDEVEPEPHRGSRREVAADPSLRRRRSVSPVAVDGSRRVLVRERLTGPNDKKEYPYYRGDRTEKGRSRSPPYRQIRRIGNTEEEILHRKFEYDSMEYEHHASSRSKHVYAYNHGTSRITKENDYIETRVVGADGHSKLNHKTVPVEDGQMRGSRQLRSDMGPASNYGETGRRLPLPSQGMDMDRYEHEKLIYRDPRASDERVQKPVFHSRDVSHNSVPASSALPRNEFPRSYRAAAHFRVPEEEYSRTVEEISEPAGISTSYERRLPVDSGSHPTATRRNSTLYQQVAYSPGRAEPEDYYYRKHREMAIEERRYPSGDVNRIMPPQTRVDYDHVAMDYDQREISRPRILRRVPDRTHIIDDSDLNTGKSSAWVHPAVHKRKISEYIDMRRSSGSRQADEYLGPEDNRFDFVRPQDYEASHFDAKDHQVSNFGRQAGPEFQKTRTNISPLSKYNSETERMGLRTQKMKEKEFHMYEPSDRIIRRKYVMEDDLPRSSFKNVMPSKLTAPENFEDVYDGHEWVYEDTSDPHFSQNLGPEEYKKVRRTYDEQDHSRELVTDDWGASEDSSVPPPKPGVRFYKDSGKFVKGNTRLGSLNWHSSHHPDRRSHHQKEFKVWKTNDNYDETMQENDTDVSEDLVNHQEPQPSEDTEEFKQLVNEAFLKYTKSLNLSQSVRRRYKEQGNAGSLFCIVCGRSYSKEFLNTERLVNHCFMCHKARLRSEHLGLHKAVCVLLGWDTTLPIDAITWLPQELPEEEALAQKEDLILWPPIVVIHNKSMSNNNPQDQQVIPLEGVQAYLREKGFIAGRVDVCLGRPADQSVMVIKYRGTFSGLESAEKLHKYFAENKRGRVEFQGIISSDGESSKNAEKGEGEKLEDLLLYGYMATSEDLDRLDFNNRKYSLIKSRKEIQELANAPVKSADR